MLSLLRSSVLRSTSRAQFISGIPHVVPARGIMMYDVERPLEAEKVFSQMLRQQRAEGILRRDRQKRHVKQSVKRVQHKERKEALVLKSKVHGLLEWVEFKQKYRVE